MTSMTSFLRVVSLICCGTAWGLGQDAEERPRKDAAAPGRETRGESRKPPVDPVAADLRRARVLGGALELEEAAALLEKRLAASPGAAPGIEPVQRELQLAQDTWQRLQRCLLERKRDRKTITVPPAPQRGAPPTRPAASRPCQVLGLDGCIATLQPQGARAREAICVLSLPPGVLTACLGEGGGAPTEPLSRGLDLLLLLHRGLPAALELAGSSAERKAALSASSKETADLWLPARLEAAGRRAMAFETASPSPSPELLEASAHEIAEALAAWRQRPGFAGVRPELRRLFTLLREDALRALPIEQRFHARETRLKGGTLELTYDFSTEPQCLDFVVERGSTAQWDRAQRALRVQGEARLGPGSPFRGRLSVSGKAAGIDPAAPNLNIALWTHPADRLVDSVGEGLLRSWRERGGSGEEGAEPADYVVLGMGFRSRTLEALPVKTAAVRSFLPLSEREPTLALIAGNRSSSNQAGEAGLRVLLRSLSARILWDAASSAAIKSASASFSVGLDEKGKLQWTLNGKTIALDGNPDLKALEPGAGRTGSVTLFTNRKTILFNLLKVTGELDPEWSAGHAREQTLVELRKLDGDLPGTKKPASASKKPETDDPETDPGR